MRRVRAAGITLVELTVMIAVMAVLFTGFSLSTHGLIGSATQNRNYIVALNLAKRQMAIMNNAAYPDVAAEAALTADPAFPDFTPTQEVVSVATNGGQSIHEIRVRVRHGSVTGPVLVALYTYRTSIASFGDGL